MALELALYVLGIQPDDEVIVPSRTFLASASCAAVRGARPVFADVDRDSQNLTAESIRRVLTPRTKAIIVVHLAGWPCDMDPILALARQHGLKVIEDCAQAQGATYKNRKVGSIGDVAAFSFCQDKIMTTCGEGGMFTTNDRSLWELAWSFKDHGKNYEATTGASPSPVFRWVHDSIGTNWRMTEMQSAVGRTLLRKIPEMVERRRHLAAILTRHFSHIPALRVTIPPWTSVMPSTSTTSSCVPSACAKAGTSAKSCRLSVPRAFLVSRAVAVKFISKKRLRSCVRTPGWAPPGNWAKPA